MLTSVVEILQRASDGSSRQIVIDAMCGGGAVISVRNTSLRGCDLSGLNLVRIPMMEVDLQGAICRHVQFSELIDCSLDNVEGESARMPCMSGCRLRKAVLVGADIGGRFARCDFSESILRFAHIGPLLSQHRTEYRQSTFDRADLHGLDAAAGYFPSTSFREARLTAARLSRANLSACDLGGADFSGANLVNADLIGAVTEGGLFDDCIVAAGQEQAFRTMCPTAKRIRIFSRVAGPGTMALEAALKHLPEFRFDWQLRSTGIHPSQKIMLTCGPAPKSLYGYSFYSDTGAFIRLYPMDEGPNLLPWILSSIAADYADWMLDPDSIRVTVGPEAGVEKVSDLLRESLSELFNVPRGFACGGPEC